MNQAVKTPVVSLLGDPNMLLPVRILGLPKRIYKELSVIGIEYVGELLAASIFTIKKQFHSTHDVILIDSSLRRQGYGLGEGFEEKITLGPKGGTQAIRQNYAISEDVDLPNDWIPVPGREDWNQASPSASKRKRSGKSLSAKSSFNDGGMTAIKLSVTPASPLGHSDGPQLH
jgi:hypothetical protein